MNNIYKQQKRQGRLSDAGQFPEVILIDTISFCNLRCSMCVHADMTRKKGIMKFNLFKKIIDEIAAENRDARIWMVFFGEALILKKKEPTIFKLIRYAKEKGLTNVVLNSNANLMDETTSNSLIDSGLDAIYIGIDAFSPETYAKIRIGGDYLKTIENVKKLIQLKQNRRIKHPDVYVQFVEMDINQHEKNDFIKYWTDLGANVKIRPKVSWAGLIKATNLILDDEDRWPCYWAMQSMSITDSGDVVTCAVDLDARFVAGNVREHSLKEIWNGKLKELRAFHISKQFSKLPENCCNCRDWQSARANYFGMNP